MPYIKVLSQHLCGGPEEIHGNSYQNSQYADRELKLGLLMYIVGV